MNPSAHGALISYRVGKFARRNRLAVVLTALVLMAIVAGTAGTLMQARTAREQRDFAFRQLTGLKPSMISTTSY